MTKMTPLYIESAEKSPGNWVECVQRAGTQRWCLSAIRRIAPPIHRRRDHRTTGLTPPNYYGRPAAIR